MNSISLRLSLLYEAVVESTPKPVSRPITTGTQIFEVSSFPSFQKINLKFQISNLTLNKIKSETRWKSAFDHSQTTHIG
jgi:hypothetical protein